MKKACKILFFGMLMLWLSISTAGANSGFVVMPTEADKGSDAALRIYGGSDDAMHRAASQALKIPTTRIPADFDNAQELTRRIINRDDTIDIYCIDLTYLDFTQVMQKGFCLELDKSKTLSEYFSSTYDYIQDALSIDGIPYAIPIDIQAMLYLNPSGLHPLMAEEESLSIPGSFTELCAFVEEWNHTYADKYTDYLPFWSMDYRAVMSDLALSLYGDYLVQTAQAPTFDTEAFRKAFGALEEMCANGTDVNSLAATDPASALAMEEEVFEKQELFYLYDVISLPSLNEAPHLLSLLPDTPKGLSTNISVLFINPYTQHPQQAIAYLEQYVRALDDEIRIMLCPDFNEPIVNPAFAEALLDYDRQIEALEEEYEKADQADKGDVELALTNVREARKKHIENRKYAVSEQSIAMYRGAMTHAFLAKDNLVYSKQNENDEMMRIYNRYLDGQLSLDQFVHAASELLEKRELENAGLL